MKKNYSDFDALFCFILSHGYEEGVYATDGGKISLKTIKDVFIKNRDLCNKPKFVLIQACRGESLSKVVSDGNAPKESFEDAANSDCKRKCDDIFSDGGRLLCQEQDFMMWLATTTGMNSVQYLY